MTAYGTQIEKGPTMQGSREDLYTRMDKGYILREVSRKDNHTFVTLKYVPQNQGSSGRCYEVATCLFKSLFCCNSSLRGEMKIDHENVTLEIPEPLDYSIIQCEFQNRQKGENGAAKESDSLIRS
jgi:hypothetical protein